MAFQSNPFPLRLDPILLRKLRFMAVDHGRSTNKEIESLVKAAVKQYEAENGPIPTSADE